MKKLLLLLPLMLLFAGRAHAQVNNNTVIPGQACPTIGLNATNTVTGFTFLCAQVNGVQQWVVQPKVGVLHASGAPTGFCFPGFLYTDDATGNLYACNSGTWALSTGGNALSNQTSGQVPIANSASTANSSKAIQGTEINLLSSDGTGITGQPYCRSASGGVTTGNCLADGSPVCTTDTFTSTPTYTFDSIGTDQCHIMVLSANVTSITIAGTPSGHSILRLKYPENGTGGFTVTFPGSFVFPTGFTFHVGANNQNNMGWEFDSTASLWRPITDFGGGGGGGGSPAGNPAAVQIQSGGNFGATGSLFDFGNVLQVQEDTKFSGSNPVGADVRAFGGVGTFSPASQPWISGITGNCNGTTAVNLSAASTFSNGMGITLVGCGPTLTMATPGAPSVTNVGARAGQNTGDNVPSVTGSTTYNYKIAAQDLLSGITATSATGSTTTGLATLGAQVLNLNGCIRSNATVTCTTASAHQLSAGMEVKIRSSGDGTFNGDWQVSTVPDNTHFTFVSGYDTRIGSSFTSSGVNGTVTYWLSNHITWSPVTGAYRYLICSDRGSPGTFNLIGISRPSYLTGNIGNGGTEGSLYFDDYGTVTTYPTPPWPIPSVCSSSAVNDSLITTIVSGGGTTSLTLANAASQTLVGTSVRADNAPAYKAAALSLFGGVNSTTVMIPMGSGQFVTNSILDLSQITNGVVIDDRALQTQWNDTVILPNVGSIRGDPMVPGGFGSFASGSYPSIQVGGQPGIHFLGPPGGGLSGLGISGVSNGQTTVVMDGGGGQNEGYQLDNVQIVNGISGAVDDMSMSLFVRGVPGAGSQISRTRRLSVGAGQNNHNCATPTLYMTATGNITIDSMFTSGRGPLFALSSTGSQLNMGWEYCQGCNTALISIAGANGTSGGFGFNLNVQQMIDDTGFFLTPLVSAFNSQSTIIPNITLVSVTGQSGIAYSGVPPQYATTTMSNGSGFVSMNQGDFPVGNGVALDTVFNTTAAGQYPLHVFNEAIQGSPPYPIFIPITPMAAPALSLSAGGSVPVGSHQYQILPVWPNGSTGPESAAAFITTTTGNQTVNLTWTPLGNAAGCQGYLIVRDGALFSPGITSIQTPCGLGSASDGQASSGFSGPTTPSGGPTMMDPGFGGIAAPVFTLDNSPIGPPSGGFTARRNITVPDITGIIPTTGYQTTAYDNFNRASAYAGGPCPSNPCWTNGIRGNGGNLVITNNQLAGDGGTSGYSTTYWNPSQFLTTTNLFAQASMGSAVGAAGAALINPSTGQGYSCAEYGSGSVRLVRIDGQFSLTLIQSQVVTAAAGDSVRLEVGTASNFTCYRNNVPLITATDTTYTGLKPGVFFDAPNTEGVLDNWSAGNFHPLAELDIEQDFTQSQHVPALTVGPSFPIVTPNVNGNLPFGAFYATTGAFNSNLTVGAIPPACTGGTAGMICMNEGTNGTNVAGATLIDANSSTHEIAVATNGDTNFGQLVRTMPPGTFQTGQTAAIATSTLCAAVAGECNVAGMYHVHVAFWGSGTACSTPGPGGASFLLTWTDDNATVHSAVVVPMLAQTTATAMALQSSAPTFPFQTALGSEGASGDLTIRSNGSVIQYATSYTACTTGTGTYNFHAAVTRIR